MSLTVLATIVSIFYFVIWFFDSFFKSCMHYPYYAFLEGSGLKVGILNFSCKTTAFNRIIIHWGKKTSNLLKAWFTNGYIFTVLVFLPFSIWTLVSTVATSLWSKDGDSTALLLETVIPGVNLPSSDIWFYFIALAVSSIIHELGHALAAVQNDVQLINVGFYVFVVIPIAFVELNTEQLNLLSAQRRLSILCAGVWHNIALAFLAFILLFSVSHVFKFGYEVGNGVRVTQLKYNSPLNVERGLVLEDQIIAINDCRITNNNDWYSCIFSTTLVKFGLCVTSDFVSRNDEIVDVLHKDNDLVNCCRNEDKLNLCFEYVELKLQDIEMANQYSCLPLRDIIKEKFIKCTNENPCPNNDHCLKPLLGNETYLFIIELIDKNPVLYIGSPSDMYSVSIDHYVPRFDILKSFSPRSVEKLFEYVFNFSLGLGIVNILPCFATDGYRIAGSIIQLIAKRLNKDNEFVNVVTICVTSIGTLITIPSLIYMFIKTIMNMY